MIKFRTLNNDMLLNDNTKNPIKYKNGELKPFWEPENTPVQINGFIGIMDSKRAFLHI